jgi:hypothetical protein
MRTPTCHPLEPFYAKGLCRACYARRRRWGNRLDEKGYSRLRSNQQGRCASCRQLNDRLQVKFNRDGEAKWLWCRRCASVARHIGRIVQAYDLSWSDVRRTAEHFEAEGKLTGRQ